MFAVACHLEDPEPSADVFSLGVILSEMLLGRFPYEADMHMALFLAQSRGQHIPLPETALGVTLARAMSPKAENRPTLDELAEVLRQTGG